MPRKTRSLTLLLLLACVTVLHAQSGEWAWEGGIYGTNDGIPTYGTLGVPSTKNTPAMREGSGTWTDSKGNLWLFGGYGADSVYNYGYLDDLWEYIPANGTWTWVGGSNLNGPNYGQPGVYGTLGVPSPSNIPGGRAPAAIWQDSKGNVWMFGGGGMDSTNTFNGDGSLNDLWMYNPATNEWTWMGGGTTVPRFGGGQSGVYGTLGVASSSNQPGGRVDSTSWTDSQGNFWLFGGSGDDANGNIGVLNDLWMYSPTTNEWTWEGGSSTVAGATGVVGGQGAFAAGNTPGGRYGASAWTDPKGNFWLFGGSSQGGDGAVYEDIWEFNPSTKQWAWLTGPTTPSTAASGSYGTQGTPSGSNVPPGRQYGAAWTDASGNLWLFGGEGYDSTGNQNIFNDQWEYSPATNQWTWINGSNSPASGGNYGPQGAPSASSMPGARYAPDFWKDNSGNFWLFGGLTPVVSEGNGFYSGYGFYSDLWEYFTPTATSSGPLASISPFGLEFTVLSGDVSTPQQITLSNPGSASLSISGFTITGTGASAYQQTNTCGSSLAAGASCTVSITFSPAASQTYPATLTIASNAPGSPQTVTLAGTGNIPTTTSIYASASTLTAGSSLNIAATVASTVGNTVPTGTVTFDEDGSPVGTGTLNGSGVATYTVTSLALGSHTFTATYPGDTLHGSSASGSVSVTGAASVQISAPQWEWVAGGQTATFITGAPPVYGTLGTPSSTNYPGDIAGGTTWTDANGNLWLFYGENAENDIWKYNIASGQWTWVSGANLFNTMGPYRGVYGTLGTPAAGNTPGGRDNNSSWIDTKGNLWIFGGSAADANGVFAPLNDLWMFNPSTSQWTWEGGSSTAASAGVAPTGVYGTKGVASPTNVPGGRYQAMSWTDKSGNFWLFGGYGSDSTGTQVYLNDLWEYTPTTGEWTWMGGNNVGSGLGVYGTEGVPAAGNVPGARLSGTTWVDNSGNLWLFGGTGYTNSVNGTGFLNDLWKYDVSTNQWTWVSGTNLYNAASVYGTQGLSNSSNMPDGRENAGGWVDSAGNLWLFGGADQYSSTTYLLSDFLNDLWVYLPSSNSWAWVAGSNTGNQPGVYGTLGTPSASNIPAGRYAPLTWTDANGNFWLMGGANNELNTTFSDFDDLWTTGSAPVTPAGPLASLSTSSLTFTSNVNQASASQSITVSNGGSATLNISGISITGTGAGAFAETTNCGSTLAAGSSCSVSVTFTPPSASGYPAEVLISDTAADSPQAVRLTGTGTAAAPAVQLSPTSLSFSSPSGTAAVTQTVTLTNSGNADLTGISFGFSNNLGGFSAQSTCPSTLSAGASCTFTIGFTPPGIVTYTNALLITDNAPNSPQSIGLTGTGTGALAAAATTYPTSLTFNPTLVNTTNTGQSITLTNTGNAPLTGITASIIGTNASDFAISSNDCSSLALGGTCTISVTFTPQSTGTFNATLSIADNASNSPQAVPLSGTGAATLETAAIAPSFLAFADQTDNTASGAITATLVNAGSTALTGITPAITGAGASAFAISATSCGTSLAAGASCIFSITFTPSSAATFNATLTVTDDASNAPHLVPLSGTGTSASTSSSATLSTASLTFPNTAIEASSPLTVTVTNAGTQALPIEGIMFGDTYENELNSTSTAQNVFSQTSTCGSALAVGASCAITVTFTPTAGSLYSGTLLIADGSSGLAQSVSLSGVGTGASGTSAALSPTLNFGTIAPGGTSPAMTATLTNSGSAALTGITPSISGGYASDFAIFATTCGSSLAAGATCTISVTYTPAAAGAATAYLNVVDNAPGSPQSVEIGGSSNCSSGTSTTASTCNPGGSVVGTFTFGVALDFVPATVTTTTATAASTEIIGKYQGTVVYDQTFPAAYGTPTVQAGVTAANAAISAAGGSGAQIPAPVLTSSSISTSTASASVYSRDPAAPVSSTATSVTFGPETILAGSVGLSFNPTASQLTECTETSLPSSTIPICFATNPGSFQVEGGQEDINDASTVTYFIDTATTATTTTTTNAVYTISAVQTATPTLNPPGGNYSSAQSVTISDATPNATIYYTTDGTTPTTNSTVYGGTAIPVPSTETINAIAVASGDTASAVATATYTITLTTPAEDWTWMGGLNVIGSSTGVAPGSYGTLGVSASTNLPPGRYDPETWTDKSGNFWMMGGTSISQSVGAAYLNDLWEYSPSTLEWTWQGGANSIPGPYGAGDTFGTQGTPSAQTIPSARSGSFTWTDPSGNLWLYGGFGVDDSFLSPTPSSTDLLYSFWKYTPSSGQWTWIAGTDYGVSADVVNSIPTYGVMGTPSSANFPGARYSGSTWTDTAGNLWMFGGNVVEGLTYYSDGWEISAIEGNDLWEFNPTSQQWTWEAGSQITSSAAVNPNCTPGVNGTLGQAAPGITPSGRGGSSSWTDSAGNLWLFGGQGCGSFNINAANQDTWGPLNDLWKFNTTTNEWTWVAGGTNADQSGVYGALGTPSAGNTPGERESANAWTDSSGKFWLFGGSGYDSNGNYGSFNDLWMFDPSTTEWTWEGGGTIDTGSAGLPGTYGTLGVGAAGNMPGARNGAGAWTDASGNLWLFGGAGEDASGTLGDLNDLWEYGSGAVATQQAATPTFSVAGGNYSSAQSVTISDATPNATIYYTIDGTTPTTGSTVYSGTAITVSSTETIEAIATASGYTQSATASATYTITVQAKTTPTVTVSPSPASVTTAQALSVTITVSGTPTPTGSVTLSSGTYTSGSVTLTNGSAIISIPAGALTTGTDTLTATYTPDANSSSTFTSASGTNTVTVTAAVVTAPVASLTPPGPLTFTAVSGSTSIAQTVTLSNTGNATLNIASIGITGTNASAFAETNTCGSSLAANSSCTISVTFSPSAAASFTANLSVADNASGSSQTITLNGTGTTSTTPAATFTLSSLISTGTVSPTTTATYSLTVTPQNGPFSSPISLTASGVPAGYTALFTPASVTPGSSPATAMLTISKGPIALLERTLPITAPALALIAFFFVPRARRRRLVMLVVFAVGAFAALTFSGCGGGFGLPTTTYNVTITASGGGVTQTTTVQLTVRQ